MVFNRLDALKEIFHIYRKDQYIRCRKYMYKKGKMGETGITAILKKYGYIEVSEAKYMKPEAINPEPTKIQGIEDEDKQIEL